MTLSSKTAFLLLLGWAFWLTAESWCLGPASFVFPHDNADQVVPVTVWLTQSVSRLWGAETLPSLCGVARLPASAWLNSSHPLFLALPPWLACGIFLALQRLVAGYFTFLAARDVFRLPPATALLAGLLYPLLPCEHGEMRLMHQFNEAGFPLLLWAFATLPVLRPGRALAWGAGLGVLAGLGMGPVDSIPFFFPAAVGAAAILRTDLDRRKAWVGLLLSLAACAAVVVAIKWPTLHAMAVHAGESHRAGWSHQVGLVESLRLNFTGRLRLLLQFWPFAAAAACWMVMPKRRPRADAAIFLLLALGLLAGPLLQTAAWRNADRGFFLLALDFTRFNRLAPFALLIAALSGCRNFLEPRVPVIGTAPSRTPAAAFAFAAGLAVFASWDLKTQHWADMRKGWTWHGLYGNAEIKALAAKARDPEGEPFRCATAGAYHEFHPLYLLANGLETADGYAVIYPDRYRKYWSQVLQPLLAAEPASAGYFTAWGSRVYLFHSMQPWNESIREIPFSGWYDLDLLSLANVRYLVSKKPLADSRLKLLPPVWDDDARDAWSRQAAGTKLAGFLAGRNPGPRQYVYENPAALPRVFLAGGTKIIDSYADLGAAPLVDLRQSVFLLKADAGDTQEAAGWSGDKANVQFLRHSANEDEVLLSLEDEGWAVRSSLWYPQSRCLVDGRPEPVLPAYGAFQAVRLGPGKHTLKWSSL